MKWYKIYFEGKNSEQMKKFSENQVQEFTKLLKKIEKMKVVILAEYGYKISEYTNH